jgi:hypothetical protein
MLWWMWAGWLGFAWDFSFSQPWLWISCSAVYFGRWIWVFWRNVLPPSVEWSESHTLKTEGIVSFYTLIYIYQALQCNIAKKKHLWLEFRSQEEQTFFSLAPYSDQFNFIFMSGGTAHPPSCAEGTYLGLFSVAKTARAYNWPLLSIWCKSQECV